MFMSSYKFIKCIKDFLGTYFTDLKEKELKNSKDLKKCPNFKIRSRLIQTGFSKSRPKKIWPEISGRIYERQKKIIANISHKAENTLKKAADGPSGPSFARTHFG